MPNPTPETRLVPLSGEQEADLRDWRENPGDPIQAERVVDEILAAYHSGITEEEATELVELMYGSWEGALTDLERRALDKLRSAFASTDTAPEEARS